MPGLCPTAATPPARADEVHGGEALVRAVAVEDLLELVLGDAAGAAPGDAGVGVAHADVALERHVVDAAAEQVEVGERPLADAGDGGEARAVLRARRRAGVDLPARDGAGGAGERAGTGGRQPRLLQLRLVAERVRRRRNP